MERHGYVGCEQPGRLGLGHRQLRVVGWYRPRGHTDFGDSLPLQAALANVHQPRGGGDDALRRGLCARLPDVSYRPAVARLLDDAGPEPDGVVAAVQEPTDVGCVRGFHLRHGFAALLVHRPHPRPGHAARPRYGPPPEDHRHYGVGLDGFQPALEALRPRLPNPCGPRYAAGPLGTLGCVVRLCGVHRARLAYHHIPTVLRCGRHLLRLRDGDDAAARGAQGLQPAKPHHARPPREDEPHHFADGQYRRFRVHHGVLHGVVQRRGLRAICLPQPCLWRLCVGVLDYDELQPAPAAALLGEEVPP